MAILSILTLYNWDSNIFEGLTVPEGIDKDVLINNLLAECADFELIYPNPDIMKSMISLWSAKENPIWEKLRATQLFDYNPIENYNRIESWETETENTGSREATTRDVETGSESQTREGESSQEKSGSVGRVGSGGESRELTKEETEENSGSRNNTGTGNNANAITTFDLNTEQPLSSTTTTGTSQESTQGSREFNGSDTETVSRTENYTDTISDSETGTSSDTLTGSRQNEKTVTGTEDNTATGKEKRTGKTSGNIGVTTTQQMIEAEREVVKFSLYDYIISSFRARFCILLY